jgi:hypothetical protein
MHEASVTQALLDLVLEKAREHHAAQVNVMGKLVDEDALRRIGIAGVAEHVFLGDRTIRIGLATAHAARPRIAIVLWRKVRPFRQVGGVFVVRHDAHPRAALNHRRTHVGTLRKDHVYEERGFLERVGTHLGGGDDGKAIRADGL